MEKAFIFTGYNRDTKISEAVYISEKYHNAEVVFIAAGTFHPKSEFFFEDCNQHTKLIIFEDANIKRHLDYYISFYHEIILPRKMRVVGRIINPRLVIIAEDGIKESDPIFLQESVKARFDIINFDLIEEAKA